MYRNTRFHTLMEPLSRSFFEKQVAVCDADRYCKSFKSWDHLIALIYGQISGCTSLRELENTYNSHSGCHYHLGTQPIKRTTLADANARRDVGLFETTAKHLLSQVKGRLKRNIKEMLYLIDASPITLKGLGYDHWASAHRTRNTQGLHIHVLYDAHYALPIGTQISTPNTPEIKVAQQLSIQPQATYVFDRGYYDYNWWYRIGQAGARFVTRFKRDAALTVLKSNPQPTSGTSTVLADEVVQFRIKQPRAGKTNLYQTPLRRITIERLGKSTPLVLATNDLKSSASEIANLYKARWQIELFFKWLKQNLKIKRFYGRSENAVKIQIYVALITYLLIYYYKQTHSQFQNLRTCLQVLSRSIFERPETLYSRYKRRKYQIQQVANQQLALLL